MNAYTAQLRYLARWIVLVAPVAMVIGSIVAFFLWALEQVVTLQRDVPWLLFLLPVAGAAVGLLYHVVGKSAERGSSLILDEIHQTGGGVPGRMGPLVLLGTLVTHLFGGSAGREGTAVQIGGAVASSVHRHLFTHLPAWLTFDDGDTRAMLQAGVAAGFASVFGTPLTGAVFALEVVAIGRLSYRALVPCLLAAMIGAWTTAAWGITHTLYPHLSLQAAGGMLEPALLLKVVAAAVAFGLASTLFTRATHGVRDLIARVVAQPWLRPALGGVVLIALTYAVGTRDYLGLGVVSPDAGVVTIVSSFSDGGAQPWSWALKLLFTAITLGAGFKGGEVTPLFFIGATLGHALGVLLHAPVALFAALGFVAVFAGAANTPLACTLMGIELFGAEAGVYIAVACFLAYLFSDHAGIYQTGVFASQRMAAAKGGVPAPAIDRAAPSPEMPPAAHSAPPVHR